MESTRIALTSQRWNGTADWRWRLFIGPEREHIARIRRIAPLALGHVVSRISSFALVAFVGRYLGAAALGEFSLAHTFGQYVMVGSDLGAKAVGARMIAADVGSAPRVLPLVLRKMAILASISACAVITYSAIGPVPSSWRWFLAAFAISALPFGMNIDWIFWGLERFDIFALWQGGVYTAYAALAIGVTLLIPGHSIFAIAAANAVAWIAGASFLWWRWMGVGSCSSSVWADKPVRNQALEIGWRSIAALGAVGMMAMLLDSVSLLVLGAIGTPNEIGAYGAASKVLVPFLGIQTILWWACYPGLARSQPLWQGDRRGIGLLLTIAGLLGVAMAISLAIGAGAIVSLSFGEGYFAVVGILRVLSPVVPCAFVGVISRAVLIAHSLDALASTGVVAGTLAALALSTMLVPRYGSMGAAVAATGGYAVNACVSIATLALVSLAHQSAILAKRLEGAGA